MSVADSQKRVLCTYLSAAVLVGFMLNAASGCGSTAPVFADNADQHTRAAPLL
jgi:hypothetical protein